MHGEREEEEMVVVVAGAVFIITFLSWCVVGD